ncbi:MAG TPA: indole-3-glycerol phosphate synthase TrpC [Fusobacteria bacterium]|nr:indole-3-glycerol phosphate synthase TrpC [Fusobacteriota bacterium]
MSLQIKSKMLKEIIANKRKEIKLLKRYNDTDLEKIIDVNKPRGFLSALNTKKKLNQTAIIAEIKRYSPSKGKLNMELDVANVANQYEENGATCISVLTDHKYFKGDLKDLYEAKKSSALPILRKDFILDESQLVESKIAGADCILLILACLDRAKYRELLDLTKTLEMDALVEVHNKEELEIALEYNADLIGINNRNLKNFEVRINTSMDLADLVNSEKTFLVSESGIYDRKTILQLQSRKINGFLIGESLITSKSIPNCLKNLLGDNNE